MIEPDSASCEKDGNSCYDGDNCHIEPGQLRVEGNTIQMIPGSMYRKSALYAPGNAGKLESDML